MKPLHLLALCVAMATFVVSAEAAAQQRPPPTFHPRATDGAFKSAPPMAGGLRLPPPSHSGHFSWERGHGFHGGFGGFLIVEREVPVIIEREVVVREVPPPPAAAANSGTPNRDVPGLPAPRKPYVIGASYASLPGGCMKLIEEGASYYFCGGGEWYREVRAGRNPLYRAVARKL